MGRALRRSAPALVASTLVAVLLIAGCGGGDATTTAPSVDPSPTTTAAGEDTATTAAGDATATTAAVVKAGGDLYSVFCAGCHGADGKAKFAPAIADIGEDRMKAVVTDGTGDMEGYGGDLSPEEIQAIVDYAVALE